MHYVNITHRLFLWGLIKPEMVHFTPHYALIKIVYKLHVLMRPSQGGRMVPVPLFPLFSLLPNVPLPLKI